MGEVFAGRFELIEPIADGGMGSVWQVRDLRDGELYAGKVLRHGDSSSLLRFMREQSTRIQHPHVVTPLSWAGEDDRVLFSMPLVRGGSVATLIGDHGALPDPWTVEILDQTLSALEAVHAAGVVHRDIKPANLLLEPTGAGRPFVRLTDFGIAAGVDEPRLTHAHQVIGSPGYMSPAHAAGADPDPTQDLWSLAAVGADMMTGLRAPESRTAVPDRALGRLLTAVLDGGGPGSATAFRAELAALGVPEVEPSDDGPYVFAHVGGTDGTDGGDDTPAASAARSVPTATAVRPRHDPVTSSRGRDRKRAVAVTLIFVALVCVAGAAGLLFG